MRHVSTILGGLHATALRRRPSAIGPVQSWTAPPKRSVLGVLIALLSTRSNSGSRRDITQPTTSLPSSSGKKQYPARCDISPTWFDLCANLRSLKSLQASGANSDACCHAFPRLKLFGSCSTFYILRKEGRS